MGTGDTRSLSTGVTERRTGHMFAFGRGSQPPHQSVVGYESGNFPCVRMYATYVPALIPGNDKNSGMVA